MLVRATRPTAGFDASADGKPFVIVQSEEKRTTQTVTVVQSWFADFRQRGR